MTRTIIGLTLATSLLACCPASDSTFKSASEVAERLKAAGVPCDFYGGALGPIIVPDGESWGHCNIHAESLGIYVLGDVDAYRRIREREAGTADDTPRIYWVYGDNWIVATDERVMQSVIHFALGGQVTDNTEI